MLPLVLGDPNWKVLLVLPAVEVPLELNENALEPVPPKEGVDPNSEDFVLDATPKAVD